MEEKHYKTFTKEMKATHTILFPDMLPIHFELFKRIFELEGYKVECLHNSSRAVVDEGLMHVHNDACYPALLVVGQFIDALKSGKYDVNKVALLMSQTGGGCRASNYINLIRKALEEEYPQIPVISLNFSGLEKDPNSGFVLKVHDYLRLIYCSYYGDLLMSIYNQVLPYELEKGESKKVLDDLSAKIKSFIGTKKLYRLKKITLMIINEFKKVKVSNEKKVKVGIVGEIYVKYSPLANNHLEDFLHKENCEVVIPALMDFIMYSADATIWNHKTYKNKNKLAAIYKIGYKIMYHFQKKINHIITKNSHFEPFHDFEKLKALANKLISEGVVMGEGWLIPAEMAMLIESGTNNIVTAQPFGCLPNHIVSKGMQRTIKKYYPDANIVAIDYDPGATQVNQENRIKLMLSNSRLK